MNLSPLAISYFLHLLATVVWIGGMALIILVLHPLQKRDPNLSTLISLVEQRFRPFANFSLLVLLLTGVVQMGEDNNYGGFLNFDTEWSRAILAKHILIVGMVGIVGFLQFGLEPALERAKLLAQKSHTQDDVEKLQMRQHRLTRINFGLGILVLVFTAIATAV